MRRRRSACASSADFPTSHRRSTDCDAPALEAAPREPGGHSVLVQSPSPAALMIRRIDFDALLVQLAVEAGVELVEGAEITQARTTDGGVELKTRAGNVFTAPHVIAADGVYSVVARRLGINPGWRRTAVALDMMEETPNDVLASVDPETLWVTYGYGGSEGYCVRLPEARSRQRRYRLRPRLLSRENRPVAVRSPGIVRRCAADTRRAGRSIEPRAFHALPDSGGRTAAHDRDRSRRARRRCRRLRQRHHRRGHLLRDGHRRSRGRALAGAGARTFERLWRDEIGGELRDSVLVQRDLLTTPERIDRLIRAAHGAPTVAALIVRYAMGEVSYATARRQLLLGSPMAALRLTLRHLRGIYQPAAHASAGESRAL